MGFCIKCGAPLVREAKFCGAPIAPECCRPVEVSTPFPTQVRIVAEFYMELGDEYEELLSVFDLGFPLAVSMVQGAIAENGLTPIGQRSGSDTFVAILEEFAADPSEVFLALDQIKG
jgi:hypothetical protein